MIGFTSLFINRSHIPCSSRWSTDYSCYAYHSSKKSIDPQKVDPIDPIGYDLFYYGGQQGCYLRSVVDWIGYLLLFTTPVIVV